MQYKKVFFDTELTGLHRDTTMISIGLVADTDEFFYAELNDYDKAQISEWTEENVIHNLCYSPPLGGQDEYWRWDAGNNVRMRGNRRDVRRYLNDWFQALLGGPMSWVDYTGHKKPKEITKQSIEIWGMHPSYDWVLFNDLWGGVGMTLPSFIYHVPFDISMCFVLRSEIDCESYLSPYEKNKKSGAIDGANGIKECYEKLSAERKSGKY